MTEPRVPGLQRMLRRKDWFPPDVRVLGSADSPTDAQPPGVPWSFILTVQRRRGVTSATGLVFARRGDTRTTLRETVVQHFFPEENPPILFFWLEPDRLSEEDVPAPDEESG